LDVGQLVDWLKRFKNSADGLQSPAKQEFAQDVYSGLNKVGSIVEPVVKVNSTNSTKTLETNLNGNKQIIPSERAQKTVKNEPKNT
jgi:hypothetical protein